MTAKTQGWRGRLIAYLGATAGQPFQWGALDCGLFSAGAIAAMTGVDPAAPVRGRYSTAAGARRAFRRLGFEDHVAFAASLYPEIPVALARAGDLAAVPTDAAPSLGIVQGHLIYVMGDTGWGPVPLLSATRAFRI